MVRVVKVHLDPSEMIEMDLFGNPGWTKDNREKPETRTKWITCPGCGWRIPQSQICSECGEDLSPRPCPKVHNSGRSIL